MLEKSDLPELTVLDTASPLCNSPSNAGLQDATASPVHSSCQQSDSHGSPESESDTMQSDSKTLEPHKAHWLWKETYRRLETLGKRAREGKCVDEASEFARWLSFSGLIPLFKAYAAPDPLEVSHTKLERLIGDVLFECEQHWKRNPRGPWVSKSELESINQKLDLLAGRLAQLSPPASQVETAVITAIPAQIGIDELAQAGLRVIEGGRGA